MIPYLILGLVGTGLAIMVIFGFGKRDKKVSVLGQAAFLHVTTFPEKWFLDSWYQCHCSDYHVVARSSHYHKINNYPVSTFEAKRILKAVEKYDKLKKEEKKNKVSQELFDKTFKEAQEYLKKIRKNKQILLSTKRRKLMDVKDQQRFKCLLNDTDALHDQKYQELALLAKQIHKDSVKNEKTGFYKAFLNYVGSTNGNMDNVLIGMPIFYPIIIAVAMLIGTGIYGIWNGGKMTNDYYLDSNHEGKRVYLNEVDTDGDQIVLRQNCVWVYRVVDWGQDIQGPCLPTNQALNTIRVLKGEANPIPLSTEEPLMCILEE